MRDPREGSFFLLLLSFALRVGVFEFLSITAILEINIGGAVGLFFLLLKIVRGCKREMVH